LREYHLARIGRLALGVAPTLEIGAGNGRFRRSIRADDCLAWVERDPSQARALVGFRQQLISVIADIVVTALRALAEHPPALVIAIPLLSVSIEVAFVAVLAKTLGGAISVARRASCLLRGNPNRRRAKRFLKRFLDREGLLAALCSRWPTKRRMREDAQTGHLARREERAAKPVLKGSTISGFETCHPVDTAPPAGEKMLLPHD
jgi:hypothetical protein